MLLTLYCVAVVATLAIVIFEDVILVCAADVMCCVILDGVSKNPLMKNL